MPDNVPMDIWREILIRLPGESLIRSRAVCKGWRAVIDDPPFFRALTNKQLNKNIIMIRNSSFCCSLGLETLSFSNGQQTISATPLDLEALGNMERVSACNGLILAEKPLRIWNPLTHERLDLPPPGDFEFSQAAAFGLGYDYVTDDYKAVVISSKRRTHVYGLESDSTRRTHVYSLKTDSWKRIMNCPWDGEWRGPNGPGVFVCGALNWLSLGEGGMYDDKIMSLDLGTEKYRLLQMPQAIGGSKVPGMLLDVLGGSLILCKNRSLGCLDVWVMKDCGDEGSWIKLFSIDREHYVCWSWGLLRPVAFITKEDKMRQVFLQAEGGGHGFRFFLFDVETNSIKRVFIHDLDLDSCAQRMFPGTIFRLHANCGGGARPKIATYSGTKTKKASDLDHRLVFCIRDHAKWDDDDRDSCYISQETTINYNFSRAAHSSTKLEDSNSSSSEDDDQDWRQLRDLFY